jgi:acetoin utilization deacetylase AcuC-like enzyme
MSKKWSNAFCITRPPGHHSGELDHCSGFCYINNVAVGAQYLMDKYKLKKILIFDWDVHHGDGT